MLDKEGCWIKNLPKKEMNTHIAFRASTRLEGVSEPLPSGVGRAVSYMCMRIVALGIHTSAPLMFLLPVYSLGSLSVNF